MSRPQAPQEPVLDPAYLRSLYERLRDYLRTREREEPPATADVDHRPGCPGPTPHRVDLGARPDGARLTRLSCRLCAAPSG